jgi:FAD/FMN-containing dehydrogenase
MSTPTETVKPDLGGDFNGELITPADPGYDEARAVYNAMIDRRPALIARCTSPADVAAGIAYAKNNDLLLAIRGGGHNGAGLGVCDDGVVLDLSPLNSIEIGSNAETVRVGGGVTLGQLDAKLHEQGRAVPAGIISTTGVGGLTLGGGIGHITRKCGLTIDNLLGADVVLADGSQVHASENENDDLFWALRGGGGNFGVVTAFEFRTHPVSTVQAGPTLWALEDTPEVLHWYRDFILAAPRELNGFFAFLTVPPVDLFPAELHLRKLCAVVWCHTGDEEAATRDLAPVHDVGTPLLHGVGPTPFPGLQSLFDGLYPPGDQWYWRADYLNEISDEAIPVHQEWGEKLPTMKSTMHMYPADGAAHDVDPSDTAWAARDANWVEVIVGVDPDPANAGTVRDWTVSYWDAVHPYSAGGAYVNMMMDEGQERIQQSYRGNYGRLAQVKAKYDPDNLFRVNQNIVPAGSPPA